MSSGSFCYRLIKGSTVFVSSNIHGDTAEPRDTRGNGQSTTYVSITHLNPERSRRAKEGSAHVNCSATRNEVGETNRRADPHSTTDTLKAAGSGMFFGLKQEVSRGVGFHQIA